MKNKLYDIFTSASMKIILAMLVFILPLNVIVLIYTYHMQENMIDRAKFNHQKRAEYCMQSLSNTMENAKALLGHFVMEDEDSIKLLNQNASDYERESTRLQLFYKIRNMASMTDGADGYFFDFWGTGAQIIYTNADGENELNTQIQNFLKQYTPQEDRNGWHLYQWNGKKYLVFLISDKRLLYGAVIRLDPLLSEFEQGMEYPIENIEFAETPNNVKEKRYLTMQAEAGGIYLYFTISKSAVVKKFTAAQRILIGLSILYLALIPLLYHVFRRLFILPLAEVNKAHRQIEDGNGKYRIEKQVNTVEFRSLYHSFNRMADNLHRLKIESYEKELAKQKMELRNLQLQIRPHFLLNTFNLIFTLSQRKEHEAIQEIVIYLSDYFRYIFRSEKELELFAKEAALIRGYVKMASVRYLGRVEAEYEYSPELEVVRMPPLLLHNFVENAVKYGVKKHQTLHIKIHGGYCDGTVTFRISDDGKGMDAETLEQNQKMLRGEIDMEDKNSHLGLYNSMKRLKYFYGEKAEIQVESEEGYGTCFTIRFPYHELQQGGRDEFIDCK